MYCKVSGEYFCVDCTQAHEDAHYMFGDEDED